MILFSQYSSFIQNIFEDNFLFEFFLFFENLPGKRASINFNICFHSQNHLAPYHIHHDFIEGTKRVRFSSFFMLLIAEIFFKSSQLSGAVDSLYVVSYPSFANIKAVKASRFTYMWRTSLYQCLFNSPLFCFRHRHKALFSMRIRIPQRQIEIHWKISILSETRLKARIGALTSWEGICSELLSAPSRSYHDEIFSKSDVLNACNFHPASLRAS